MHRQGGLCIGNQRSDRMALTISSNAQMVGSLFSSMSSNAGNRLGSSLFSSTDLLGINYMDYSSIRSGSYYKLLDAYYSLENTSGTASKSDSVEDALSSITQNNKWYSSTSMATDSAAKLAGIEEKATKVNESADALITVGTKSLFRETTSTDEAGKTTTGYDVDKIYAAVKDFADKYNGLVDSAKDSNVKQITNIVSSMVSYTAQNEKLLSKVGITVDAETNEWKIDEEVFKKADMSMVKSLFNGTASYAYQISVKASMIDYYAQNEASKANTYGSKGQYTNNYASGSIWDSMI